MKRSIVIKQILSLLVLSSVLVLNTQCSDGFKPLFNENLSNAEYDESIWSIDENGVISATADESIWTTQEYENFEIDLEFKNDVNTNSGVVIYCTDKVNWIPNSLEIQIFDDHNANPDSHPNSLCGAIYGHLGANQKLVVNKPGEWNHMNIKAKGQNIDVILNGKEILSANLADWTSGTKNPDGSDIPSWLPKPFSEIPTKGYIGFQGKHGEAKIWFRNIKIKELN